MIVKNALLVYFFYRNPSLKWRPTLQIYICLTLLVPTVVLHW